MNRKVFRPCRTLLFALLIGGFALGGCTAGSDAGAPSATASAQPSPTPTGTAGGGGPSPAPSVPAASPSAPSGEPAVPSGQVTALRLADPSAGWAGGDGWIAATADGGASWRTVYEHDAVTRQLFALNGSEVWATIGKPDDEKLALVASADGGRSWRDAGDVPNDAFLHFVSAAEAFSGNAATTDGGRTWRTLNVPANVVGDAYFHDRDNGWAVTSADAKSLRVERTTDGGRSWSTVLTRSTDVPPLGAVIRSAGKDNAWVLLIGDSGMTQTSYSLLATQDGGRSWQPVLANAGAGSGPAPGFPAGDGGVPANAGNSPGALYVVSPKVAFMGGQCQACDRPNTLGSTTDGGRTWVNLPGEFPGHGPQLIAAADADRLWWALTDAGGPSVLYTSDDGGRSWTAAYTFPAWPAAE